MLQSKQRLLKLNSKLADTLTSKGIQASSDETTTALVDKVSDISSDDGVLASLIDRTVESIVIPNSVTNIGVSAFDGCKSLKNITIPDGVTNIGTYAFNGCKSLENITIPDGVTNIGAYAFIGCKSLEFVKLGQGFNANNLDLSASTKYTRETILQWLNALADRTGQTAYKLIIGPANLKKLTQEDIAIATAKNWTLA